MVAPCQTGRPRGARAARPAAARSRNFPFRDDFAIVPAMSETAFPRPGDALDLLRLRRVLVIKLRHLGDVLLTSPVFTVLKNHAPHLEIDALVYRGTEDMLSGHPALSRLHTIDKTWKQRGPWRQAAAEGRLLATLRARRYDLVIHLTEHPRGAWLKRLTGARWGVARQRPGRLWQASFSHLYPWLAGNRRHTVELHLDALRRIGVWPAPHERALTFVPGPEAEAQAEALLAEAGLSAGDFLVFHPGSRWGFKTWPAPLAARLLQLLHEAGWPVAVTAAPDAQETAFVQAVLEQARVPVANLAGRLSLKAFGALVARARVFIGMDSAPMHIAAAMRTPTVALFGPSGEVEWGPWGVPCRVLTAAHPCRPCGHDGCGGGKLSECLAAIQPEAVLAAVEELAGRA